MQGQQVQPVRLPDVPLPQTMDGMCPVHGRIVRRDLDDVLHASVGESKATLPRHSRCWERPSSSRQHRGLRDANASLERRGTAWRWR